MRILESQYHRMPVTAKEWEVGGQRTSCLRRVSCSSSCSGIDKLVNAKQAHARRARPILACSGFQRHLGQRTYKTSCRYVNLLFLIILRNTQAYLMCLAWSFGIWVREGGYIIACLLVTPRRAHESTNSSLSFPSFLFSGDPLEFVSYLPLSCHRQTCSWRNKKL